MTSKSFLISDFDVGFEKDKEPFLLPEKAFPVLEDAYVFRGRVKRRFGYNLFDGGQLNSRLRINLGMVQQGVDFTGIVPGIVPIPSPGRQQFSIGTEIMTSNQTGAGVQPLISTGAATGTLDNTTGDFIIAGATPGQDVFYYPGLPVMGLRTRETTTLNFEQTIGFDTQFVYERSGTGWAELTSTLATLWTGTNSEFFWTINYRGANQQTKLFWVTNGNDGLHGFAVTLFGVAVIGPPSTVTVTAAGNTFQNGDTVYFLNLTGAGAANNVTTGTVTIAGDPIFTISNPGTSIFTGGAVTGLVLSPNRNTNGDGIRTYDGTTWANLNPALNTTTALMGCKILYPFKNRVLALNTFEGNSLTPTSINFPQRLSFSQNGDATNLNLGWRTDIIGRGGSIDAATSEVIVSAQFVQNRLIVFFERSTWEIVYTGNEILPFVWQRINTELGCESTFSQVVFDDGIVGIGNRGIHIANPNGVQRIDEKIPDLIGEINNLTQGAERVYGIRDFSRELVIWSFTQFTDTGTFPNKNLIYNYRNNTFAVFNSYFTCFGYFQKQAGITWATLPYADWIEWTEPWNAGISQARFTLLIAGNQQGFTHLFESNNNDASLIITDVTNATLTLTVPDHNLLEGDFIRLSNMNGLTFTSANPVGAPLMFKIDSVTTNTITLKNDVDPTFIITGTYTGGGLVEVLNNFDIRTKNFTFFADIGFDTLLNDVEVLLEKTSVGECTFNIFQGFNTTQAISPDYGNSTLNTRPEDNDTFGNSQNKIWHFLPRQVISDSFQFQFTLSDAQMRDSDIQGSDFVMHALLIDVEPTGRLRG